jgi:hypothetical protein
MYIVTADLLGLAEKDEATRRTVALYLAENAKKGTPRQREIAKKSCNDAYFLLALL